ncbi:ProQ/FINO family protein [Pokkaliibacter sp. MBI-7]|uniref:ProQ/FINO family protein n=1 Tax=Pokkaliibacter sp. MBI-7 TaxID=3040600 RepID=UPI00244C7574|nr:ProQ/FINO family protein [Pokkaliibacter sp. MBI-7]MDH2435120.1 ProQ/FINO family protein [Pokkaliibacter sp. MBI-7]
MAGLDTAPTNLVQLLTSLEAKFEKQLASLEQARERIRELEAENQRLQAALQAASSAKAETVAVPSSELLSEPSQSVTATWELSEESDVASAGENQAEESLVAQDEMVELPEADSHFSIDDQTAALPEEDEESLSVASSASVIEKAAPAEQASAQDTTSGNSRNQRKNKAANRAAVQWLMDSFPLAFSRQHPKPLQIGIQQSMMERLPGMEGKIKRGLASYTRSPAYLRCVQAGKSRVDIDGKEAGHVEERDAQHAREQYNSLYGNRRPEGQNERRNNRQEQGRKPARVNRSADEVAQNRSAARLEEKLHQLVGKHLS